MILKQLIKVITSTFLQVTLVGKVINYRYVFKSERWLVIEYNDRVEENHKWQIGVSIVKLDIDEEIDEGWASKINRIPLNLGAFISSNNKRTMDLFYIVKDHK